MVQDPNCQDKNYIIEYPVKSNRWYIVRCLEHNFSFGVHPLRSAAGHLHGGLHNEGAFKQDYALKKLGAHVLDCTSRRAKRCNLLYRQAVANGFRPKKGMTTGKGKSIPNSQGSVLSPIISQNNPTGFEMNASSSSITVQTAPSPIKIEFQGVTDPVVGHIYQCVLDHKWHLVVILPIGDWNDIGIDETLSGSGLAESRPRPACYDWGDDDAIVDWTHNFKNGGPKVKDRQFAAFFFHSKIEVPHRNDPFYLPRSPPALAWVDARNLRSRDFVHPPSVSLKSIQDVGDVAYQFEQRVKEIKNGFSGTRALNEEVRKESGRERCRETMRRPLY